MFGAKKVAVGLAGCGYWGRNLARNLHQMGHLAAVCDPSAKILKDVKATYKGVRTCSKIEDLLADAKIKAVAIAAPAAQHYEVAKKALLAGKDVFVEKPLALRVPEAEELVELAARKKRILMIGHILEYHPAIQKLKDFVDSGELGDIHYIYSHRLNLGQLRSDENALWSLGAHDISVVLHLADEEPYELSARGEAYKQRGIEDVVFGFLRFPSGLAAHLHLSWLDPHKERRFTVVGSKRMATFDDMDIERKVTVYDKGFDETSGSYGEYITRAGDIWSPSIGNREPLRLECEHFVESVREGRTPRSDGASGLRVVRVLERLQDELELTRREVAHG